MKPPSGLELLGRAVRPPVSAESAQCTKAGCKGTLVFRFDEIGRVVETCPDCVARAERSARDARLRALRKGAA